MVRNCRSYSSCCRYNAVVSMMCTSSMIIQCSLCATLSASAYVLKASSTACSAVAQTSGALAPTGGAAMWFSAIHVV